MEQYIHHIPCQIYISSYEASEKLILDVPPSSQQKKAQACAY